MHEMLEVGDIATLNGTFTNQDGDLADPASVVLLITKPDGTTVTKVWPIPAELTHPSTGHYSYDQIVDVAGVWTYEYTGAGGGVDASETEYLLVGRTDHDGPCDDWVTADQVFQCRPASVVADADKDYGLAGDAASAASRILYLLSDRKYPGICTDTVRPCKRARWQHSSPGWEWNRSWGSCSCASFSACGCNGVDEIHLGSDYPVLGVQSVYVDGSLVPSTAYRVDDDFWLVRLDDDVWPSTQDLSHNPLTDTDTFQVTYWYGRRPSDDGIMAAKRLASELYAACTGSGVCQLPKRIQTISRQGETIAFLDPQEFLENGRTGLYEVDLFLAAERHGADHLGTVVVSPEFTSQLRR